MTCSAMKSNADLLDKSRVTGPMPIICRLGFHRPAPMPRWNDGYYFTRCTRCRRDLVRTAFDNWHPPRGHRVVWREAPPPDRRSAALEPVAAGRPLQGPSGLPIDEVLQHLNHEGEGERGASARPQTLHQETGDMAATRERFWKQQFDRIMSDDPSTWDAGQASDPVAPTQSDQLRMSAVRGQDAKSGAATSPVSRGRPSGRRLKQAIVPAAVTSILILAVLGLAIADGRGGNAPSPETPTRSNGVVGGGGGVTVYVSASLLDCRATPAEQAPALRVLPRGRQIEVISQDGTWFSVSHLGRSCWVQGRHLSLQPVF